MFQDEVRIRTLRAALLAGSAGHHNGSFAGHDVCSFLFLLEQS